MPLACTITNIDTGHSSFPPTNITNGSPNVNIEGLAAARVGDPLVSHGSYSPSPPHSRAVASGSDSVFINGIPACRIGDQINCGGVMATSNSTVSIGG